MMTDAAAEIEIREHGSIKSKRPLRRSSGPEKPPET
jgi:hypothetical protein